MCICAMCCSCMDDCHRKCCSAQKKKKITADCYCDYIKFKYKILQIQQSNCAHVYVLCTIQSKTMWHRECECENECLANRHIQSS